MEFAPTRDAGKARLAAFLPKAGRSYAARRNFDLPGHSDVSGLSPYIRHRLVTEEEVLTATLAHHSASAAEKFVQEVFWRTYWKGWLERRPSVWVSYQTKLRGAFNRVQTEAGLRSEWEAACAGDTGIDCFDHWAKELVETGYLHNHARMWFASIWIFTLRLPWTLGADFFLRHLLDGDPASNTLGWRWVAGLQTRGKTYLARADNIQRYTGGRFRPTGLASFAAPLDGPDNPPAGPVPQNGSWDAHKPTALILHEDDPDPGWLLALGLRPVITVVLNATSDRSPLMVSPKVTAFVDGAIEDVFARYSGQLGEVRRGPEGDLSGIAQIVAPYAPQGPARDALTALNGPVQHVIRPYDARAWPHAKAGFFKFKERIPKLLSPLTPDAVQPELPL